MWRIAYQATRIETTLCTIRRHTSLSSYNLSFHIICNCHECMINFHIKLYVPFMCSIFIRVCLSSHSYWSKYDLYRWSSIGPVGQVRLRNVDILLIYEWGISDSIYWTSAWLNLESFNFLFIFLASGTDTIELDDNVVVIVKIGISVHRRDGLVLDASLWEDN